MFRAQLPSLMAALMAKYVMPTRTRRRESSGKNSLTLKIVTLARTSASSDKIRYVHICSSSPHSHSTSRVFRDIHSNRGKVGSVTVTCCSNLFLPLILNKVQQRFRENCAPG